MSFNRRRLEIFTLKNILDSQSNNLASSPGGPETESSPFSSLFGGSNVCFKTCGMEDIQFAARVFL